MSTAEKICPTCGTEYPANERFCPRDGTALRSQGGGNDLVGSIIAERYHVMKKLGEGGMGQVYLAEHVKMGRKSAVKVMNPGMVHDADAISRFNREAANASRINHPNVAGIYDFGETPDGLIYLAMEFIEGESLTSVVEKNPNGLTPIRAADITKQAADGLQVAHDMGIVHRDLKPDNIMIAKGREGTDLVKVVDFGIAKAAGSENQKVTKTGLVVGTPEYMSPEQLAGDKLDGRSDVYSLALVAFNMLTGKLPFQSESAQESMIMRLTDEPKTLAEMKPDTSWPAEVQAVMRKALQRKREDRYANAADFGKDLYIAVERMPKQAAGATQMIGAMDGATAVISAPPPTRVASPASVPVTPGGAGVSTTGGGVVAAPAKSKGPLFAGVGAAVVAAAVAGYLVTSKGPSAAPPTPHDSATHVTAPAPTGGQTGSVPQNSTGRTPQGTTNPGHTVAGSSTPGQTVAAPGVDISARLPKLLDMSSDEGTAAAALKEAESLKPSATKAADLVGLDLVRAQAKGFLSSDSKESCEILHGIEGSGASTEYSKKIQFLLKQSC